MGQKKKILIGILVFMLQRAETSLDIEERRLIEDNNKENVVPLGIQRPLRTLRRFVGQSRLPLFLGPRGENEFPER